MVFLLVHYRVSRKNARVYDHRFPLFIEENFICPLWESLVRLLYISKLFSLECCDFHNCFARFTFLDYVSRIYVLINLKFGCMSWCTIFSPFLLKICPPPIVFPFINSNLWMVYLRSVFHKLNESESSDIWSFRQNQGFIFLAWNKSVLPYFE